MAKSKVLKELANNGITIEVALSRLMIIATDIGNEKLCEWAENELNGYDNFEDLPEYRKINAPHLKYTGINGRLKIENQPMPLNWFTKETRDSLNPVGIFESVANLQTIADDPSRQQRMRDLTFLAGEIQQNMGVSCVKIIQVLDLSYYREILNKIRGKLLRVFIELDKSYGNLDDLDVSLENKSEAEIDSVNSKLIKIVIDKSVHIGDGNTIKNSKIGE